MAWKVERTVVCRVCGAEFRTYGNASKYCPACAQGMRKKYDAKYYARKKLEREPNREHTRSGAGDTPEQIAACLSCRMARCDGQCERVKQAGRKTQHVGGRRGNLTPELAAEILRLRGDGMSANAAARELGVPESTMWKYVKKLEGGKR